MADDHDVFDPEYLDRVLQHRQAVHVRMNNQVGDVAMFVEAVLWIAPTGSPWRDLPAELGNWHTTYTRFSRWCKRGRWLQIMHALGGDQDLEALMIDSTVIRAHQHAAGAQKKRAIKPLDAPEVG